MTHFAKLCLKLRALCVKAVAVALAFLAVIPTGNLLLRPATGAAR
jgi:hypothetical protein